MRRDGHQINRVIENDVINEMEKSWEIFQRKSTKDVCNNTRESSSLIDVSKELIFKRNKESLYCIGTHSNEWNLRCLKVFLTGKHISFTKEK